MNAPIASSQRESRATGVGVEPRRFRPRIAVRDLQDLYTLARNIGDAGVEDKLGEIRRVIDIADAWAGRLRAMGAQAHELQHATNFAASLRVLRDLVLQGWTPGLDDDGMYVLPPDVAAVTEDASEAKADLRTSFQFAVADQLHSTSVSNFIERMEDRGIANVYADGPQLAERIEDALQRGEPETAVMPYLQLVSDPKASDRFTGLRLQDIWRYSRLQWSIPYQSTPGRNVHYLVRDAASVGHPIIGIAALGNAILGLNQRDDALGWTVRALEKRLANADPVGRAKLGRHLLETLDAEIGRIYAADLKVDLSDLDGSIERLGTIHQTASADRLRSIDGAGEARTDDYDLTRVAHTLVANGRADEVDWNAIARTDLYRKKRAANLAELLRARQVFDDLGLRDEPEMISRALQSTASVRAVETVLRRIKQRAIAENVMEIITCGAVAPYQQLLGGKLVAMLMTSPQVVHDFQERYTGRVSLIASGLAGRPVTRVPRLVALTTSSLYSVGSAQYNRVRIPGAVMAGDGDVRYTRVGTTDSFGTVQFASDTTSALADAARIANDNRRVVNNLFGEGMSPKLRTLRMGLEALGLPSDEYLRHHSPRLLYATGLAKNTEDVLLGLTGEPDYVLTPRVGVDSTRAIADYWATRWMRPRLERVGLIESLRTTHKSDRLLSSVKRSMTAFMPSESSDSSLPAPVTVSDGPIAFVERLYRNTHSYADRLTLEELEAIHVDLGLDDYILSSATSGKQLVITGNPGDGKTFLVERLRASLEASGAIVISDANSLTDTEILAAWRTCAENNLPLVLAINEWPLFALRHAARLAGFLPVAEAVRQVHEAVYYGTPPAAPAGAVRVIDLNLRNTLAGDVVRALVERLTAERFVEGLDDADPAALNAVRLRTDRVASRIALLLDQVARRGGHTTMRHLVGYVAYLVTGGTSSGNRLLRRDSGDLHFATLAFQGGIGPLFDLVNLVFDPANVSSPEFDEALWRGGTSSDDWVDPLDVPAAAAHCAPEDRDACFRAAKRRFFFEHARGDELLAMLPNDENVFDTLLSDGVGGDPRVLRQIAFAINRFYEPDSSRESERSIKLWQSHRFDAQAPSAFISTHTVQSDHLHTAVPVFAEWVEEWLPKGLRRVHEFAVVRGAGSDQVQLVVDRELFLTLQDAAIGLNRSTWARSVSRKITRFVDELQRQSESNEMLSDLEIRNVETDLRIGFEVTRSPARYFL